MPNQAGAPLPQDVHPQAYQPGALGGPPGPQWGAHAQNPPPLGPAPPPLTNNNNWGGNRLADLQNPQVPPQPMNPYDQRDRLPPQQQQPQAQGVARQPSPRPDLPRYQEHPQRPPPPPHRGLSPTSKPPQSGPAPYQPAAPHPGMQGLPSQQLQAHLPQQEAPRPIYGPPPPSSGPPTQNGVPGSTTHTPMPQYARQTEPQPEIRPIVTNAAPSPGGHYARTPFEHHANPAAPSIASGAPPPTSAPTAADAAARERDDTASSVTSSKRHRDWDEESSMSVTKKATTDESRSRLDEIKMQRPSPPQKVATPPNRSPPETRRMEEPRPASAYRPSEAAHHPPSLPPMQSIAQPSPRMSAAPQEEHRAPPPPTPAPAATPAPPPPAAAAAPVYEPAARKMDVDENYDDSGDDKSAVAKTESKRSSPRLVEQQA